MPTIDCSQSNLIFDDIGQQFGCGQRLFSPLFTVCVVLLCLCCSHVDCDEK